MRLRTLAEAAAFFEGMEVLDPGVVQVHKWRPEPGDEVVAERDIGMYGGVARKP
ncbi:SAM-dependent methyltransferase [Streptomyces oceani]|uniref:SAM-dependent methyltransferase n=1 Tax=Streptomyces oceani TaxID=1075402 RepID=UPI0009A12B78